MEKTKHILDYNKLYSLQLEYDPAKQQLKVSTTDDGHPWPRFKNAVAQLLNISTPDLATPELDEADAKVARRGNTVTFSPVSREFTLYLGKEPIGRYSIDLAGNLSQTMRRPLTVDETRRIGTFHLCEPYPERREGMGWDDNEALLRKAKQSVFTDFHTHSSGQISAQGLLDVALKNTRYYYPISLLKDAGINTSYEAIPARSRMMIPRVPFTPKERPGEIYPAEVEAADLHALAAEELQKLIDRMKLPADRQSTFKHLEYNGNRFRYPFSKDERLTKGIREQEASEYLGQGIRFALSSFVGIEKPDILRTIHETTAASEKKGFHQRFMIGIPRGLPPEKMREMLEKSKILLDSPYIVGVDILGYESNKTKEFIEILDEYAKWANEHRPGSFIRVHAGENDKNHDNVKDFLKLAVKYPNLKFLVGHGIYGMDKETTALAKKLSSDPKNPQLTLEYNPSSNIALNNVDDLKQIPFENALKNDLPFIVGSDSAGMYQTDATQLGLAAYHAGLDSKGFDRLHDHQQYLFDHVMNYSRERASHIPDWETNAGKMTLVKNMLSRIDKVPRAVVQPTAKIDDAAIEAKLKADQVSLIEQGEHVPELEGKHPITIIGASGASWSKLPKGQQRGNAIAVDMLIHALGDNCYIMPLRNKKIGLSSVINKSRVESNEAHARAGRPNPYHVGMNVNPSFDETNSYKHLTHMIRVQGQALDLADAIVDHTFEHDGVIIAIAGAAYTRDTILEADQRGIHDKDPNNRKMMLLLGDTEGASGEKARVLHPDYMAMDGKQLVRKLFEQRPDLFPRSFKLSSLNDLYKQSSARVTTYGYNVADSTTIQLPAQLVSRTEVAVKEASTGKTP